MNALFILKIYAVYISSKSFFSVVKRVHTRNPKDVIIAKTDVIFTKKM